MKRYKEAFPKIKRIYPLLFWKECRFCGKEFRRENGFEIVNLNVTQIINIPEQYNISYCCSECCNDENEVVKRIKKEKKKRDKDMIKKMTDDMRERNKRMKSLDDEYKCRNIGSNPEPKTKRPKIPKLRKEE